MTKSALLKLLLRRAKANPAMALTMLRIVLIPLFVLVFYLPITEHRWLALSLFIIAAISDFFDGYLARKLGLTSELGAFLDPVADKLLVVVVLIALVSIHPTGVMIFGAMVIIVREVAISALREFMANQGKRDVVAVSKTGKLKTAAQMLALGFLIVYQPVGGMSTSTMGYALLLLASALTISSMFFYCRAAWQQG